MHILFFTEKAVKYSKYDPRSRTKCHLRLQKTEPRPRLPFQIQCLTLKKVDSQKS